jgi:hypothetical protein
MTLPNRLRRWSRCPRFGSGRGPHPGPAVRRAGPKHQAATHRRFRWRIARFGLTRRSYQPSVCRRLDNVEGVGGNEKQRCSAAGEPLEEGLAFVRPTYSDAHVTSTLNETPRVRDHFPKRLNAAQELGPPVGPANRHAAIIGDYRSFLSPDTRGVLRGF